MKTEQEIITKCQDILNKYTLNKYTNKERFYNIVQISKEDFSKLEILIYVLNDEE